ncbi:MAG: glycosyltransferase family 2 protein [Bacteroidetes bacterium]|nr:glycosyltransferase family 2 protein [Bacteroidota bacterium]
MISIIMPFKNPGNYFIPCVESILNQSYKNWELIAVNDHSDDGSFQLAQSCANKHTKITVIDSKGDGIIQALRCGYEYSKGDYIHRMDSDDIMPRQKLEKMMEAISPNSLVTGLVDYFSDDFDLGDGYKKYTTWINQSMKSGDLWKDIYKECPVPSSAWLLHRDDFESVGAFNSSLIPEDYEFSFRLYQSGIKIKIVPEVIHRWRDSTNRTSRMESQYFPENYVDLKVGYFLKIDRNKTIPLVLWGAGKKGKKIARVLLELGVKFTWVTDNPLKFGVNIYNQIVRPRNKINLKNYQQIIAISSPSEQIEVQSILDSLELKNRKNYFWFC